MFPGSNSSSCCSRSSPGTRSSCCYQRSWVRNQRSFLDQLQSPQRPLHPRQGLDPGVQQCCAGQLQDPQHSWLCDKAAGLHSDPQQHSGEPGQCLPASAHSTGHCQQPTQAARPGCAPRAAQHPTGHSTCSFRQQLVRSRSCRRCQHEHVTPITHPAALPALKLQQQCHLPAVGPAARQHCMAGDTHTHQCQRQEPATTSPGALHHVGNALSCLVPQTCLSGVPAPEWHR